MLIILPFTPWSFFGSTLPVIGEALGGCLGGLLQGTTREPGKVLCGVTGRQGVGRDKQLTGDDRGGGCLLDNPPRG